MKVRGEYLVVRDDGSIERLPRTTLERLLTRTSRLEDEAGQKLRMAEVQVKCDDNGVPVEVLHIIGSYLKLDEDGFLDEDAQIESAGYAISRLEAMTAGPVVGLDAERERRELHKAHRWELTPAQRRALTQAALGHPRATPNIPSVKITKEKHAAEKEAARLSWRARKAIDELRSAINSLGFKIDCLDAEDMEGLETAIRKEAEEGESWVRAHWQAIARQIQYRAEVASALQTGSGE